MNRFRPLIIGVCWLGFMYTFSNLVVPLERAYGLNMFSVSDWCLAAIPLGFAVAAAYNLFILPKELKALYINDGASNRIEVITQ
jgi:hypothetical protein